MSDSRIRVNLSCMKCGGIPMPDSEPVTDKTIIKCNSCGHVFGTFAEVKAQTMEAAKQAAAAKFKNTPQQ